MNIKACLMHNSDDWKTPSKIYKQFMDCGYIDCFPYKADYDEFKKEYRDQKLFINPPFSKMDKVAEWVIHHYIDCNCTIALLIPARTDTKYFHKLIQLQPEIIFIKGRLHYNDDKNPAPFPTILMNFTHAELPMYRGWEQCD